MQQQQDSHGRTPPTDPHAALVVNEDGKSGIWRMTRDSKLNERIYYQRNELKDKRAFHVNKMIQVGVTKTGRPILRNPADVWFKHPDRKQFIDGIEFDPSGKQRPGIYNLWQGFAVKPKQGHWEKMQHHLLTVVCAGDRRAYDYLRRWLARMVQFPAEQGEVAIELRGLEGVGKSIFGDAMRRLFGQHGFAISTSDHLVGKFNAHLRDCVLLFADEAFFPGDRQHVGALKALITQPYLTIEGKGKDTVLAPNFIHLIMASNDDWVVPASLDARRFSVLDVLPTHKGDRPYFRALLDELLENGGLEAMLYDLLHEDLSDFDHRDVPETVGLQQQKKLSLPVEYAWWEEVLQRGYVFKSKLGLEDEFRRWIDPISTELLYASYQEFAKEKSAFRRLSREGFARFMAQMKAKRTWRRSLIVGEHLVNGRAETVIAKDRATGFALGGLNDSARPGFLVATNLPIEWLDQVAGHDDDPD
jgi:hypothetical protein